MKFVQDVNLILKIEVKKMDILRETNSLEKKEQCDICDRYLNYNERYIDLSFSFCGEYKCGMRLCLCYVCKMKSLLEK